MERNKRILSREYSQEFDKLRQNRMITSFYKYGPISENYGNKLINCMANLEKRLEMYKKEGNIEYLIDVANFAMIEFMFPQHGDAHFNNESTSPGLMAMTYRDIENT